MKNWSLWTACKPGSWPQVLQAPKEALGPNSNHGNLPPDVTDHHGPLPFLTPNNTFQCLLCPAGSKLQLQSSLFLYLFGIGIGIG